MSNYQVLFLLKEKSYDLYFCTKRNSTYHVGGRSNNGLTPYCVFHHHIQSCHIKSINAKIGIYGSKVCFIFVITRVICGFVFSTLMHSWDAIKLWKMYVWFCWKSLTNNFLKILLSETLCQWLYCCIWQYSKL